MTLERVMTTSEYTWEERTYEPRKESKFLKKELLSQDGIFAAKVIGVSWMTPKGADENSDETVVQFGFEITEEGPDQGKKVASFPTDIDQEWTENRGKENETVRAGIETVCRALEACGMSVDKIKSLDGKRLDLHAATQELIGRECFVRTKASSYAAKRKEGPAVLAANSTATTFVRPSEAESAIAAGKAKYSYLAVDATKLGMPV